MVGGFGFCLFVVGFIEGCCIKAMCFVEVSRFLCGRVF